MSSKKVVVKRLREISIPRGSESLPDVAFAAVASSRRQKDVSDFISFLLSALQRNCGWLNSVVGKHTDFKCALMVGAGPNRFQIQEIIFPISKERQIKLEVEVRESEDHDKIAIAALLKMPNHTLNFVMDFIKTRLNENRTLQEDMLAGKSLGINFAVLRPYSDKVYRVMERIAIGNAPKSVDSKKRRDEKSIVRPPLKRAKRIS